MTPADIESNTTPQWRRGFGLPPFPVSLSRVIARLPQYPPSAAVAFLMNLWLREVLRGEELHSARGKVVCLEVQDLGLRLLFELHQGGVAACTGQSPDLIVSAQAADFCALARRAVDADTLFFSRRLLMMGDTDLGLLIRNTIDATDPRQIAPHLPSPSAVLNAVADTLLPRLRQSPPERNPRDLGPV